MGKNKKLKKYFNLFSGYHRAYPDFLIIGAQKAATTSLFYYITQHPDVEPPLKKEIRYFDLKYHLGSVWYRSHFPLKSKLKGAKITGEKSTDYVFHPKAPQRIKESGIQPKLILLLRDPARRAISQYNHYHRRGIEKRSMQEAFEQEPQMVSDLYSAMLQPTVLNQKNIKNYIRFAYLQKGLYLKQIKRFEEVINPGHLYIESMENLMSEPARVVKETYQFLGIDDRFLPDDMTTQNEGSYEMANNNEMLQWLHNYFQTDNEALFKYLGKRFPWGK
ncbi:MAG TPA: sulfotransferase domain-containing protein [Bacteroidales bacterium]|nr:sulfotransferase domain-containing protein [Bacteroidales bacterium]